MTDDDNDDLAFYVPLNIIQVILRRWKGDNKRLCAMKCYTVMTHEPNSASTGF